MKRGSEDIIFALNPGSIRVDDIVLTSDLGMIPFGIRTFINPDFSHAALCTRTGMLFEAVLGGVLRRSVIATYVVHPEWIKVLRPKSPLSANAAGLQVSNYAERMYGRANSIRGAIASLFPTLTVGENEAAFCASMIAQAYADFGVNLLPGYVPSKICPSMLLDSPELIDVTPSCVRGLGSISDADLYTQVIETADNEMLGDEMQMNRRLFKAIKARLGDSVPDEVRSLSDLWNWLSKNGPAARKADAMICETLEREGYFKWYEEWSGDVQLQIKLLDWAATVAEHAMHEGLLIPEVCGFLDDLTEILPLNEDTLAKRRNTMEICEFLAKETGLKTFNRFCQEYRDQYMNFRRLHYEKNRLVDALRQYAQNQVDPAGRAGC